MIKSAIISPCERYRYWLKRQWDDAKPQCTFIMLNPSTADANDDDPTVLRCISFARLFGCGSLEVVNLYGWRATEPRDLRNEYDAGSDVVGPDNDDHLLSSVNAASLVIAAWGAPAWIQARADHVLGVIEANGNTVFCLGKTHEGRPKHPLARGKAFIPYSQHVLQGVR